MGVAYDLFGNGKTAVKAQLGRYMSKLGTEIAERPQPDRHVSELTATRHLDRQRTGTTCPIAISGISAINGECGVRSPTTTSARTTRARPGGIPAVLNGYGKRDANWDFSTEMQHELRPGSRVTGGYDYNTAVTTRQRGSRSE